jgi:hypothetical protein
LLTNDGSKEEVLAAINSIFTNFAGFVTAIGKPNSVLVVVLVLVEIK